MPAIPDRGEFAMKTLEQRVKELKDQRTAKEAALQEQADRESKLMDCGENDVLDAILKWLHS